MLEIKNVEHLHYEMENHKLDKITDQIEEIKIQLNTILQASVESLRILKTAESEKDEMDRIIEEKELERKKNTEIHGQEIK